MALDDRTPAILDQYGPRIATPLEWERAMGFPDDYTLVPYRGRMMTDSPRYKMCGNSMHVLMLRWIGERIQAVEAIQQKAAA
jgi:DNA (cytosine-5)-methyltransferase 1